MVNSMDLAIVSISESLKIEIVVQESPYALNTKLDIDRSDHQQTVNNNSNPGSKNFSKRWDMVEGHIRNNLPRWLDKLGQESAAAQQLKTPITSYEKFTENQVGDRVYLLIGMRKEDEGEISLDAMGLLRVGPRDLYMQDACCLRKVKNCRCVLDFYVKNQRHGFGRYLFSNALASLNVDPGYCAYDRPTQAMIGFLKKHHHLGPPKWQHNHFVIFDKFQFC